MYYIKETYPNSNTISSNILFKAWVNNFRIKENYENWTLTGDVYIFSNSFLPNYSYSLNINNHVFDIKNINLIWLDEVLSKNTTSNGTAFNITKYTFSQTINLSNSSIFRQEINNQAIYFNFSFNFNQNVFIDFDISYKENIRREFINQINLENYEYQYIYSNTYYLNNMIEEIYVDNVMENKIVFNVPNFFDINEPINNLINVSKNNNIPFRIKDIQIKIKYKVENLIGVKELTITKKNIDHIESFFQINIDDYYDYDVVNDEINKTTKKAYKGIFIPKKSIGEISVDMNFEYNRCLKRVLFDRQFRYKESFYDNGIRNVTFNSSNQILKNYSEAFYGL